MEIIGYILAILVGLSLGLIGSGGSILTVPILVYFFGVEPVQATSYSLLIVGLSSAIGASYQFKNGHVNIPIALTLSIVSMVVVFITRKYILPQIPDTLLVINNFQLTKSFALMVLFSGLIFTSATLLLLDKNKGRLGNGERKSIWVLILCGLAVGLITGFLGAGGGFLIVPTLLLVFRTSIKTASGTSLAIITINAIFGVIGDIGQFEMDWPLILVFIGITLIGLIIGLGLHKKVDSKTLTRGFAWFLLFMALFVLLQELIGL